MKSLIKIVVAICLSVAFCMYHNNITHATPSQIVFPVIGKSNYSNTFLAFRSGQVQDKHHAIDIFAPKHSKIVSPVDGVVSYMSYPEDSWGWQISILGDDGYDYGFIHVNNDTPGTDDGRGGAMHAYAPDMKMGHRVVKGQHIAYVGDSGNAEDTPPHLHLEIINPEYAKESNYSKIPLEGFENPYPHLVNATYIGSPVIYPQLPGESLPFGPHVQNRVSLSSGSFSGNKKKTEYVVGVGPGSAPQVRIFNQDDSIYNWGFFAYAESYRGGVNVAAGDVDGDGVDEIVTGTNKGSTTHVKVFKQDGTVVGDFFAYPGYYTGVNVAVGDLDGDGKAEIVTGTGAGSTSHVKIFRPDGSLVNGYGFFAYGDYHIGADVAVGDVDGDGKSDIVTSTNRGSRTHIKVFSEKGSYKNGFFAYSQDFFGGAQLSLSNIDISNGKLEILVAPRSNGGHDFRVFDQSGVLLRYIGQLPIDRRPWEIWWSGSYDIAGLDDGVIKVGTGEQRRSSIRTIKF